MTNTTNKLLLDKAVLIFKNATLGNKLTLNPQQQQTVIQVIDECDRMARDRQEFVRTFREFWESKAIHSPNGEIVSFFKQDWIDFCKAGWGNKEENKA